MINRVNQTNFGTNFAPEVQIILKKAAKEGRMSENQFKNIEKIAKDGNDHLQISLKDETYSSSGSMAEMYGDFGAETRNVILEAVSLNKDVHLFGTNTYSWGDGNIIKNIDNPEADEKIENFLINLTPEKIIEKANEHFGDVKSKIQIGLDKLFNKD